jgi:hypothetical protein
MRARRDHRDGCFARSRRAAARPPPIERVKEVDGSGRKRDSCDMLKKRRRLPGVAVASLLLAVVAACTFTLGTESYTNGSCGAGQKACPDQSGASHCVGFDHAEFGCGHAQCAPCSLMNATARCDPSNNCAVAACNTGFAHCDSVPEHGCETSIFTDVGNCGVLAGACGHVCDVGVGSHNVLAAACVSGACQIGSCTAGYRDCDRQISNGCECPPGGMCTPTGGCVLSDAGADAGHD